VKAKIIAVSMFTISLMTACSGGSSGSAESMVNFVATQDGAPLEIKADLFDTPVAKAFMTTGKK
jgi:cytochrome c-L